MERKNQEVKRTEVGGSEFWIKAVEFTSYVVCPTMSVFLALTVESTGTWRYAFLGSVILCAYRMGMPCSYQFGTNFLYYFRTTVTKLFDIDILEEKHLFGFEFQTAQSIMVGKGWHRALVFTGAWTRGRKWPEIP